MTLQKQDWFPVFLEFIKYLRINSKETQAVDDKGSPLDLWGSQKFVLDEIIHGMEHGIRTFMILKARQLGISTVTLALDIFYLAMFPNIPGVIVTENEGNRTIFRDTIRRYIESFPKGFFGTKFQVVNSNKDMMLFSNGSRLDFVVAGKTKDNWAEGRGYVLSHLTEVAAYGSEKGLASFRETISETHPNRLCIYESTAKGMNHYRTQWDEFARDELSKKRIFIGWYHKDVNAIKKTDARFAVYGVADPDPLEQELMDEVEKNYGYKIKKEQLAWYRWRNSDTTSTIQDLHQNLPWTANQAFVATGYSFFQMALLQNELERCRLIPFKGYKYVMGNDFWSVVCEHIYDENRLGEIVLRVWEEPVDDATYVIGCDPAHGRDEKNDRHAINVMRCFGDKLVQVAEYADNETGTRQAAWVLAHLAGAYKQCVVNVEAAPGPGGVIMNELENLRERMRIDDRFDNAEKKIESWDDFLSNARWYLYKKPDHFAPGFVKGWESNWKTKVQIMEQLRDKFVTECIIIRSKPLVEEMMDVIRDGDSIGAPESAKDDRVIALALCNRAWIDSLMLPLLSQGETYEAYLRAENGEPVDKSVKFMNNIVSSFFMDAEQKAEMPRIDPHKQWLMDRGFL
jgi:hypothetical protein